MTFMTLMPHPLLMPPSKRTVSIRVDNACSVDALWVRQVGRGLGASLFLSIPAAPTYTTFNLQKGCGPAIAEVIPCMGGLGAAEVPFILDQQTVGAKSLLLRAHPVGIAALMYWDAGALGRDVKKENWRDAADRLVGCALAGELLDCLCCWDVLFYSSFCVLQAKLG